MLLPLDCLLDNNRQQVQNIRTREGKELEMSGGGMESMARLPPNVGGGRGGSNGQQTKDWCRHFQMPLHYPRYTRLEYETMPELKLDCLLTEYGLSVSRSLLWELSCGHVNFSIALFVSAFSRQLLASEKLHFAISILD